MVWAQIDKRPSARASRSHHFTLNEMPNVSPITGGQKKYVTTQHTQNSPFLLSRIEFSPTGCNLRHHRQSWPAQPTSFTATAVSADRDPAVFLSLTVPFSPLFLTLQQLLLFSPGVEISCTFQIQSLLHCSLTFTSFKERERKVITFSLSSFWLRPFFRSKRGGNPLFRAALSPWWVIVVWAAYFTA